jgi:hypothetical protein
MVPRVRRSLRALRSLARSAERVEQQLSEIRPAMRANGSAARASTLEDEMAAVYEQMGQHVERLLQRGIVLRDVLNGVVDFPCRYQGRVIMLCWQVDEPELGYWHEADAGYLTRQSIEHLSPESEE